MRIYMDHNATSPLRPAARAAMLNALELCGNPSSIHAEGRAARALIESSRATIAAFAGVGEKDVILTSGGTEALNLALSPNIEAAATKGPFELLLAGGGEHAAVFAGHRFPKDQARTAALTPQGVIDLEALGRVLARASADGRRVMLALQAANNETGVIQPIAAAAEMIHAAGGFLVCDAVQAAGRIDLKAATAGADAVILSAHKFGGPKGAGALCLRSGDVHIREPLLRGGGQERGLRAGTENVAAIAGMAAAAEAAGEKFRQESRLLAAWRDELEGEIARLAPEAVFFGRDAERLPNTSCFALPFLEAHVLLISLDLAGIAVSSGSACSSGKVKRSHVLSAMSIAPELAQGALRVSLGWNSRREDCLTFLTALENVLRRIKARRKRSAA